MNKTQNVFLLPIHLVRVNCLKPRIDIFPVPWIQYYIAIDMGNLWKKTSILLRQSNINHDFFGGTLPLFSEKTNSDCQMPGSPHLFWTMLWHDLTACDFTAASGEGGWLFSNWIGQINIGKIGMYHRPWGFLRGCIANSFFFFAAVYMENMMIGRWKAAVLPIFRQSLNVYSDGASYPCFQHLLDGGRGVVARLLDVRDRMASEFASGWPRYNWDVSHICRLHYGC